MKVNILFSTLLLISSSFISAQELQPCGTKNAVNEALLMNPSLLKNYEKEVLGATEDSNSESKAQASYTIPVVFHILHQYGTENISDAQVYDVLEIMNREYNAADPDSVDVVPEYDTLIANTHISFKLAAIDPYGNCTNGIEHIYSHETNYGDAFSKINQWNRSKYLNIWVAKSLGASGAAAYALYPSATDGSNFWLDGIMSLHYYVGSIGTSNPSRETTITHEVGHCLNLAHVWGSTNDPGVACGDDGVSDTPVTAGYLSCPLGSGNLCDVAIQENIQNYMEYSYCSRMFTPGQTSRMHNALEGVAGQRINLWNDTTLTETGVKDLLLPQDPSNELTVPLCAPIADFYSADQILCIGSFASFKDASWNAVIDSREWTFEDGSPATSTSANPNVSWTTSGWKKVTLTVTNAAGSDTRVENSYIYVAPDWPDYTGPTSFNMESNTHLFIVQNPEDNYGKFGVTSGNGYNASKAFKLQTYKDVSNADPYTKDWFYNNRLEGSVDNLITPSVDLRNTTGITVTFRYAYATNATMSTDITEVLKVYSSRNCGGTWTTRKTINNDAIVTAGYASNSDFNPSNNTMWKTASFTYTATSADVKTRFKFEFSASDLSSNLLIDDINITGTLGLNDDIINNMDIVIYPNPTNGEAINVSYNAQNEATQFILRDLQGKVIAQQTVNQTNGQVNVALENTKNLSAAYYFLEVRTGDSSTTKKVVVL